MALAKYQPIFTRARWILLTYTYSGMYWYIRVHRHVLVHTHTQTCTGIYTYSACTGTYAYTGMYWYIHVHRHVLAYTPTRHVLVHTPTQACTGTYTYSGMYWYIHEHRHVLAYTPPTQACTGTYTYSGMYWHVLRHVLVHTPTQAFQVKSRTTWIGHGSALSQVALFFQPRLRISSSGMPPCCPCNANGVGIRCKKCVCAKSARACSNCAPGRSDPCQCQNRPLPVASTPSLSLPLSYSAAATPPTPLLSFGACLPRKTQNLGREPQHRGQCGTVDIDGHFPAAE